MFEILEKSHLNNLFKTKESKVISHYSKEKLFHLDCYHVIWLTFVIFFQIWILRYSRHFLRDVMKV